MGLTAEELLPSRYLRQEDVPSPILAHIDSVEREVVGQGKEAKKKNVMSFQEPNIKPMVLNNTNTSLLLAAYCSPSDLWTGKPVEIYVDRNVIFAGKRTGGLRVRIPSKPDNGIPF